MFIELLFHFRASLSYKDCGVDIDVGNEFVQQIQPMIKKTRSDGLIGDIGGFAGLFRLNKVSTIYKTLIALRR